MQKENEYTASQWYVREARQEEFEWCAQLMSENDPWITLGRTLEQCRLRCANPGMELYVAARQSDDSPGGFLLLDPNGVMGYPYVASVAVVAEHRSLGLGRRLIGYVEKRYRPTRKFLFLCVSSFNPRAQALYLRLGFKTIGLMDDFVVDGLGEWLMFKRLDDHEKK